MSRPMRRDWPPAPEKAVGQQPKDFTQGLCMENVALTVHERFQVRRVSSRAGQRLIQFWKLAALFAPHIDPL
ncbi:MAG: hypothetical protein R3D66_06885 [Alphaproteobacteria bacterium]